jgi:phage terminase large subunit-like protein
LDIKFWEACKGRIDRTRLRGRRCYAGLDLSSSIDISALVLLFPYDDGHYEILPYFWIPADNMEERIIKDKVPYREWVREGLMEATPGNVIDYEYIEKKIQELGDLYRFDEITYDPWGSILISQHLADMGFEVVECRQGYKTMSPAVKELQRLIMERKIVHDGNPVMRWMFDNIAVKMDPAENIKFDKSKATKRIDGMVALAMAIDCLNRNKEGSVYDQRGLISL